MKAMFANNLPAAMNPQVFAKQRAFVLADQLLQHRTVSGTRQSKTDLSDQLTANIQPDVAFIAKIAGASSFVELASISICVESSLDNCLHFFAQELSVVD